MRYLLLSSLIIILAACSKVKPVEPVDTANYFPLAVGQTLIYEVDSILYSPLYADGKDTFKYEMKETIIQQDEDLTGNTIFIVERVEREKGTSQWIKPIIGQRLLNGSRAELVFDNLRFVPLTFPMIERSSWDGNQFIPDNDTFAFYQDWSYTISAIDVSASVNGINFDSIAVVDHIDDNGLLSFRFSQAKYARSVGLIEQTQYNLWFIGSQIPNLAWEEKATNGFIVHWRIKDF